jgi:thiol-disulfide isomerase/thioredoxin
MNKIIICLIGLLLVIGCTQTEKGMTEQEMQEKGEEMQERVIEACSNVEKCDDWKEYELTDVLTNQKFKISDFKGKPVLIESFAVWCPTCKKQQDKIIDLHEQVGDSVVSISLDTDPNEDEAQIIAHANKHEFDWIFAVSPPELTQALIDEFGQGVVFAPQAPVVLICGDQSARLLKRGVKSADELKAEIEKC